MFNRAYFVANRIGMHLNLNIDYVVYGSEVKSLETLLEFSGIPYNVWCDFLMISIYIYTRSSLSHNPLH